ncbi:MAG: glutamate--cysteine ligase, partial [Nocardioidaceae bacterium]|nr:glutamate--cysteine ligase [Nocardioidaceae bacterium]
MGQDVGDRTFTREDRTLYRAKIRKCLDILARMLTARDFSTERPMTGIEIEFNLVDAEGAPALKNAAALEAIDDEGFQTELGQFNIEINVPPRLLAGLGFRDYEESIRRDLNAAQARAEQVGANMVMIGILPTLEAEHMTESTISANPRYRLLSEQILAARGEDIEILIDGVDRLETTADTIMLEAACTSTQLHLQVDPDDFAAHWNASQA